MPKRTLKPQDESSNIALACPDCGHRFNKSFAWIKQHDHIRCPACNEPFGLGSYKSQVTLVELGDKAASLSLRKKGG